MADRRAQWAKWVRQWRQSGLTARAFAASIGVKSGSLTHWAWRLRREQVAASRPGTGRPAVRQHRKRPVAAPTWVEVIGPALPDGRFELTLGNGRRLHIPAQFEPAALERLLAVLEPQP